MDNENKYLYNKYICIYVESYCYIENFTNTDIKDNFISFIN